MPGYWLMKSEPTAFSIDDFQHHPQQTTCWDGVRNYQARNYMRTMQCGDLVFLYHSNCDETGIVGIMEVVKMAYPDHTAFDPQDHHYDPESDPANPRWDMVDVRFQSKFPRTVTLAELKQHPVLEEMPLLRRGNRLSVMPVTPAQWSYILQLAG